MQWIKTKKCVLLLYFQEHVWDASHYLVRLVFSGLKEMFTGTREIQVGSLHLHKDRYIHQYKNTGWTFS